MSLESERKAAAEMRIRSALERIQRAQRELDEACADIGRVVGAVSHWERIGKLSDRVKAEWYRVRQLQMSGEWTLDDLAPPKKEQP